MKIRASVALSVLIVTGLLTGCGDTDVSSVGVRYILPEGLAVRQPKLTFHATIQDDFGGSDNTSDLNRGMWIGGTREDWSEACSAQFLGEVRDTRLRTITVGELLGQMDPADGDMPREGNAFSDSETPDVPWSQLASAAIANLSTSR